MIIHESHSLLLQRPTSSHSLWLDPMTQMNSLFVSASSFPYLFHACWKSLLWKLLPSSKTTSLCFLWKLAVVPHKSPPLSKFYVSFVEKILFEFQEESFVLITQGVPHFSKASLSIFNSLMVIFNNTQKNFFPSQSLTNFKKFSSSIGRFPYKGITLLN